MSQVYEFYSCITTNKNIIWLNQVIFVVKLLYHHGQTIIDNVYLKIVKLNRQCVDERH